MEAISNTNLFTNLTEDEAAALNGGFRRCAFVWQRRCFRRGWRIFCTTVRVTVCR